MASHAYVYRPRTDMIYIHLRRNQPDIGLKEVTLKSKRSGCLDSGYHFIQRQNGAFENDRPHDARGSFFPNSIDINVICAADEPSEYQEGQLDSLIDNLQIIYPGVQVSYV